MHDGRLLDTPSLARRAVPWLALAAAALLAGCGGGGGDGGLRPGLVAGAPGAACDGANLDSVKSAVFVSTQGNDAGTCGGSASNACLTIQRGIDNCPGSGCAVLVRHGLYPTSATINLRDGVSVYGGCRFDGDPDRGYRTTIQANPTPGTAAIAGNSIDTPTVVHGLVVIGKNEQTLGTASIAMAISNSNGLSLTRSVLVAGSGGDGGVGVVPAPAASGSDGRSAAAADFVAGGQGPGGPTCDAGGAGAGGDGSAWRQNEVTSCGGFACNCDASGGLVGNRGGSSGAVAGGGGGGAGTQGNACWEGVIRQGLGGQGGGGAPGSPGPCSAQGGTTSADVWGGFAATHWQPGTGGVGGAGAVGSGGGGGGPGGMCALRTGVFSWVPAWGAPGGGGGGGGCAGAGGSGGRQGGASVALVLAASSLPVEGGSAVFIGGQGGRGGHGGMGGIGGPGGTGGYGRDFGNSNCNSYDAIARIGWGGPGGPGGVGGPGGAGGGGAGGNGGPSVGIALVDGSPAPANFNVYPGFSALGAGGGTGGLGGANNCAGASGQHGVPGGVAVVFDAAHPPRNVMTPGQTLHAIESLTSPDGRYLLSMQTDNNLVLYALSNGLRSAVWDTATEASQVRPGVATMQTDGNFVIYDANGGVLFPSSTDGHPGASLRVQDDGQVQVVNADGSLLWYAPCKKPSGGIACSPSRWK